MRRLLSITTSLLLFTLSAWNTQAQDRIVLYENDFDRTNAVFVKGCSSDFVSQQNINSMYKGTATANSLYKDAVFNQMNTAEILYHDTAETVYKDPQNIAGKYSLAINYSYDRLSLTFKRSDLKSLNFFNVAFDMTAALPLNQAGNRCGVASTNNTPRINVKLYQHQTSTFNASSVPATSFASQTLEGVAPGERKITSPNANLVYNWKRMVAPFDISNTTLDYLTVTFDLANATYVALDNFYIDANVHALPIHLISFKEEKYNGVSYLTWLVGESKDFKSFVVEASEDGASWVALDSMPYIETQSLYQFPAHQHYNFYRLLLIDKTGDYTYSTVLKIVTAVSNDLVVFPNPVLNSLAVTSKYEGHLSIIDVTGKVVWFADKRNTTVNIDLSNLPRGVYLVQLITDVGLLNHKIIKK